ncbi:winged helix-turn-helix domain-containing protein [Salinigranum halophilum]|uniref:winged helix-turn-helix domain-containing protein n=1 Tax=Salinigranum halophilum TaxID=2565931 RepID=UPI0010A9413A|nr:helix-turn-helix domain-containing protein [Salinigranum halophilum]
MSSTEEKGEVIEDVFETLGDELSRQTLAKATTETVTASSLADSFDVAPATVYRRLNQLADLGFINEVNDIREGPSSETGYQTDVDALVLLLSSNGFDVRRADNRLDAALSIFLDCTDVKKAEFSFEEGTATVTLSMDDDTLRQLHDSYREVQDEQRSLAETGSYQ